MSVTITVPTEALAQFRAQLPKWVERTVNSIVYRLQTELRKQLPKRKRKWEDRAGLDVNVTTRGDSVYLEFFGKDTHGNPLIELLNVGAPLHFISPGEKGFLAWQPEPGVWRYSKAPVLHPGSMKYVGIKQQLVDFARNFLIAAFYNAASELAMGA